MNKKTAAALIIAVIVAFEIVAIKGSEGAIAELHPEIDSKILRKAHRQFLKDTLRGSTNIDVDTASEDEIDAYFMKHYVNPIL